MSLKETVHTPGAQVLKDVHPAAKMCTQSAGLNFEHCIIAIVLIYGKRYIMAKMGHVCEGFSDGAEFLSRFAKFYYMRERIG